MEPSDKRSSHPGASSVLVFAPLDGDGQIIADTLEQWDIPTQLMQRLEELEEGISEVPCPALCIVLSHEASGPDVGRVLREMYRREPGWSSPPLIILAESTETPIPAFDMLTESKASPTPLLLKRPVPPRHFISAVENQIVARRRQFEVGSLLAELSKSERHQKFLLNELRHRTRNSLAVIKGMFRMTARSAANLDSLVESFDQRLTSMATAQTALSDESLKGLSLRDIISTHAGPYAIRPGQLDIQGPDTQLKPEASFELAMIVHELATNAAKYGALSVETGKVAIAWRIAPSGDLHLKWTESGGPPTTAPTHEGLGTRIIRASGLAKDGAAQLAFTEVGLAWSVEIGSELLSPHGA